MTAPPFSDSEQLYLRARRGPVEDLAYAAMVAGWKNDFVRRFRVHDYSYGEAKKAAMR